jgi:peptidyl-prolyl cis-trans isomerase SurA
MKSHLLILLCAALIATGSSAQIVAQNAQFRPVSKVIEADRIVAVVNDEAITMHELQTRMNVVERQLRSQGTQLPPRDVLEKQVLERMIVDRVQIQYAKETATHVDDTQLDAALRRIAESNHLSLNEFRAALEQDGVAWGKFREEIRDEMTISRLREREVDNRINVSEGEIDNYLANPQGNSGNSDELNLAHILLRVSEQANPEQLMRVRARAEQALAQLQRGDDFAKVAASFSDAPDALTGGALGPRGIDRLPSIYAEAAQKLKAGEVSEILRSPAGFHIIKLLDRRGGSKVAPTLRQTHARHILIKVNELVPEAEAKRKAFSLKERLDHGADFAELAKLNSNDMSAAKGGDLGWLYQGDTVPEFERAMDALRLNEISQPVQSQFGWHIIQVLERRIESASAERQRQIARQALRESKADEAYQDWIRQMRDRAYVEVRLQDK